MAAGSPAVTYPRPALESTCCGQACSRGPAGCSSEPTPLQSPGILPPPLPPFPGALSESIFSYLPSQQTG